MAGNCQGGDLSFLRNLKIRRHVQSSLWHSLTAVQAKDLSSRFLLRKLGRLAYLPQRHLTAETVGLMARTRTIPTFCACCLLLKRTSARH